MDVGEVREWLRAEAEKRSVEEMIAGIESEVAAVERAVGGVPDPVMAMVPAGDEWSVLECLRHVVQTDLEVAGKVLWVALTGELPADGPPAAEGGKEDLLRQNREALDSLYEHLRAADPGAFLEYRWEHSMLGEMNWREWTVFIEAHNWDHARQLASMVASLE